MDGFTSINNRRLHARKSRKAAEAARVVSDTRIPGAVWKDTPFNRSHLPGIPYSYYDDEIIMIRQRTAELIETQRQLARVHARSAQRRRNGAAAEGQGQGQGQGQGWYTYEQGKINRVSASEWQGVDE
jgi:hypothetical protein